MPSDMRGYQTEKKTFSIASRYNLLILVQTFIFVSLFWQINRASYFFMTRTLYTLSIQDLGSVNNTVGKPCCQQANFPRR